MIHTHTHDTHIQASRSIQVKAFQFYKGPNETVTVTQYTWDILFRSSQVQHIGRTCKYSIAKQAQPLKSNRLATQLSSAVDTRDPKRVPCLWRLFDCSSSNPRISRVRDPFAKKHSAHVSCPNCLFLPIHI